MDELARIIEGATERLVATVQALEFASTPHVERGIDFYLEVERFERLLIQWALRQAEGSQTKAAALLKLKPTTLHSKIKHYATRGCQG